MKTIKVEPEVMEYSVRLYAENGLVYFRDEPEEFPVEEVRTPEFIKNVHRLDELFHRRFGEEMSSEIIPPTEEEFQEMKSLVKWLYEFIKSKVGDKYTVTCCKDEDIR